VPLTSASLADLTGLIVEARQRRITLQNQLKSAEKARNAAYRWHYFRSRFPLRVLGANGIQRAKAKWEDSQSRLAEIANSTLTANQACLFETGLPLREGHADW
jgi:hypothetical protein